MFKDQFVRLCNEKNVAPSKVCKDIGLSSAIYSCWTESSVPRKATLLKLADYFGVSVDRLLGEDAPHISVKADIKYDADALNKKTSPKSEVIFLPNENIYMIPLFESVSAGFGAYPSDKIIGYQPCRMESKADAEESICIRVSGDSMFPKIEDGDIIQVHKQESVDSGRIAVVLIDGEEAVVKKVVYAAKWVELQSFNPMYPPMRFDGNDVLRVRVLGQVRSIIKTV